MKKEVDLKLECVENIESNKKLEFGTKLEVLKEKVN